MTYHSTELFAKAQMLIPGGVNSPVRAFKGVEGTPLFFERGEGPYLFDVEGKRYIDYVGAFGPLILGHAHPLILKAVQEAMQKGLGFSAPTPLEVEMAECITKLLPSIEQIRMVNSGTEATQTAIRLARGFTNRPKILKFEGCYHGHTDSLLVKAGSGMLTDALPDSTGIPNSFTEHTLVAAFNDILSVETLFKKYGEEIAAMIVEPIAGNMNCIPPVPGFLEGLRNLCTQYGSVLIFDEVMTGFRVALGGAQSLFNVTPDLTCLGKIIGGGLPVGALGGKREIMQYLAPVGPVYQAGTLSGNPVTLAAGLKTLQLLQTKGVYEILSKHTQELVNGLKQAAQKCGIPLSTHAVGGMFGLFFTSEPNVTRYQHATACNIQQFKQFFHGMLKEGIYFAPSAFEAGFVSLAHTQETLDKTLEAAMQVFARLGSTSGALHANEY